MQTSVLVLFLFSVFYVSATDTIRVSQGQSSKDVRALYTHEVLSKALELTQGSHGPFEVEITSTGLPNQRALEQLQLKDGLFNVAMAITRYEWEKKSIAIRIPVRMGILSYRLLAVHKDNLDKFKDVHTIEQLKSLSAGLRVSWATSEIMSQQGYKVVNAYGYDSLFAMLEKKRFDYIPRGVHEIYDEISLRNKELPNLVVEPNLAIVIPSPYYIFVSNHAPRIAERLEIGLESMVDQGILKQMLKKYYARFIQKANIKHRRVLHVGNESLPPETPLNERKYWIDLLIDDL